VGNADDLNDATIAAALRHGDTAAFDRVYATYHTRLFAFLLRLSRRRDVAEDLTQETWLKLARAAPSLPADTKLAPLLFTIARNAFVSHRRWAMLDLSRVVVLGLELVSDEPLPDEEHEHARAVALLERALAAVPLASREVLLLVGVEGLDREEAARVVGISYDALRQRLHRARTELRLAMEKLERSRARDAKGTKGTKGAVR
jgi:RNA polymerase sigma-70 factor (ECF subfamily)